MEPALGFSDSECAALGYVSELTKGKKVDSNTFACLAAHFNEPRFAISFGYRQ